MKFIEQQQFADEDLRVETFYSKDLMLLLLNTFQMYVYLHIINDNIFIIALAKIISKFRHFNRVWISRIFGEPNCKYLFDFYLSESITQHMTSVKEYGT